MFIKTYVNNGLVNITFNFERGNFKTNKIGKYVHTHAYTRMPNINQFPLKGK